MSKQTPVFHGSFHQSLRQLVRPSGCHAPAAASAREVIGLAVRNAREENGGNCATLEVVSDRGRWAQIMKDSINCSYPHREDPGLLFPDLFGREFIANLEDFNPNGYMMIRLHEVDAAEATSWLAEYFTQVLGVDLDTAQLKLQMEFL